MSNCLRAGDFNLISGLGTQRFSGHARLRSSDWTDVPNICVSLSSPPAMRVGGAMSRVSCLTIEARMWHILPHCIQPLVLPDKFNELLNPEAEL